MDSRIREALEAKAFDTIIRCRPARVIMYDDALSLLTAEPEPCEDARAFAKSIYMDVCERVEKDGYVAAGFIETYAEEIAAYASKVADKRAEEHKDIDGLIREVNIRGDEIVKLLEQVETLRKVCDSSSKSMREFSLGWRDNSMAAIWARATAHSLEIALAATEPKT